MSIFNLDDTKNLDFLFDFNKKYLNNSNLEPDDKEIFDEMVLISGNNDYLPIPSNIYQSIITNNLINEIYKKMNDAHKYFLNTDSKEINIDNSSYFNCLDSSFSFIVEYYHNGKYKPFNFDLEQYDHDDLVGLMAFHFKHAVDEELSQSSFYEIFTNIDDIKENLFLDLPYDDNLYLKSDDSVLKDVEDVFLNVDYLEYLANSSIYHHIKEMIINDKNYIDAKYNELFQIEVEYKLNDDSVDIMVYIDGNKSFRLIYENLEDLNNNFSKDFFEELDNRIENKLNNVKKLKP